MNNEIMTALIKVMAKAMELDSKIKLMEKLGIKDEMLTSLKAQLASDAPAAQIAALTLISSLIS